MIELPPHFRLNENKIIPIKSEIKTGEYSNVRHFIEDHLSLEVLKIIADMTKDDNYLNIKTYEEFWDYNDITQLTYGGWGYDDEIILTIIKKLDDEFKLKYLEDSDSFLIYKSNIGSIDRKNLIYKRVTYEEKEVKSIFEQLGIYSKNPPRLAFYYDKDLIGGICASINDGYYDFDTAIIPTYQGRGLFPLIIKAVEGDAKKSGSDSLGGELVNLNIISSLEDLGYSIRKESGVYYCYKSLAY
jgi:hypothetical protein